MEGSTNSLTNTKIYKHLSHMSKKKRKTELTTKLMSNEHENMFGPSPRCTSIWISTGVDRHDEPTSSSMTGKNANREKVISSMDVKRVQSFQQINEFLAISNGMTNLNSEITHGPKGDNTDEGQKFESDTIQDFSTMPNLSSLSSFQNGSSHFRFAQADTAVRVPCNIFLSSAQGFSAETPPLSQRPPLDYFTRHYAIDVKNSRNFEGPGLYERDVLSQSPSLSMSELPFPIAPDSIPSSLTSFTQIMPAHDSGYDTDRDAIVILVSSPTARVPYSIGNMCRDPESDDESPQYAQKKHWMNGENTDRKISDKEKKDAPRAIPNRRSRFITLESDDKKRLATSKSIKGKEKRTSSANQTSDLSQEISSLTKEKESTSSSVRSNYTLMAASEPHYKQRLASLDLVIRKRTANTKSNDRSRLECLESDKRTRLETYKTLYSNCSLPRNHEDDLSGNIVYIMHQDDLSLSPYQCLIRMQIEYFEAGEEDVKYTRQGRNKPISLHQVGIRCRFCSMHAPLQGIRGSTYFPTRLEGIYQACQNMASVHLSYNCPLIPEALRMELLKSCVSKSSIGGGKQYWAETAKSKGIYESNGILLIHKL